MVKTKNQDQIDMYEIDVLPKLVYFESEIPTFWPDEVTLQVSRNLIGNRYISIFTFLRGTRPSSSGLRSVRTQM